jgi:hypothetical protein
MRLFAAIIVNRKRETGIGLQAVRELGLQPPVRANPRPSAWEAAVIRFWRWFRNAHRPPICRLWPTMESDQGGQDAETLHW